MHQDIKLLNSIYNNAYIGKQIMAKMIRRAKDAEFKKELIDRFDEYTEILLQAGKLLKEHNAQPVLEFNFSKPAMDISLEFNMLINSSTSHFAEMILQGSAMGIIDTHKSIKECPEACESVMELANKLIDTEDNNFVNTRKWL